MRKYVAAVFSIAIAIGPAAGTSIGIGASVGGLGGADAGASVDTSNGSVGASIGATSSLGGASIGASGSLGGANGGLSAGAGGGTSSASGAAGAPPGATPGRSAASRSKSSSVAPAAGVRQSIALPWILWPSGRSDRSSAVMPGDEIPGIPRAVVSACREAIESAATPFGVVDVRARSAGSLRRLSQGAVSAPVQVRIRYARQGGAEIRQARIRCHLDATGRVIGLT